MEYLKKIARRILRSELNDLEKSLAVLVDLRKEKEKLEKKIRRLEQPENILLSYYRIDNIGSNGLPPSYLRPENVNEYTQRVHELESVYRNTAFRELMAWTLNFHANLAVVGKMENQYGDEIDVPSEHAKHMISGIKAVWELIVAAHTKDKELTAKKTTLNYDDMLDELDSKGIY